MKKSNIFIALGILTLATGNNLYSENSPLPSNRNNLLQELVAKYGASGAQKIINYLDFAQKTGAIKGDAKLSDFADLASPEKLSIFNATNQSLGITPLSIDQAKLSK